MKKRNEELLPLALDHIVKLLHDLALPEIPSELADNEDLRHIHGYLSRMRDALGLYAKGDFSPEIQDRGVFAGRMKALQAHLRHMIWQVKQVEEGDFSQRVHFLGEFSDAFNSMVAQLDTALASMRRKEAELIALSASLQKEIIKRNTALHALEQREAEFRYLAEHDPLTGVLNRRSFFELAGLELQRNTLEKGSCCLIMLDVDFFKKFNDAYGHLEGDKALRHVADLGKSSLRQKDIMARFGGEEFIFLLPHSTLKQGQTVAERIRRNVADHPIVLDSGEKRTVTVSMGLVELPTETEIGDANLLNRGISAADEALYQAKHAGRNIVRIASIDEVCQSEDASGAICARRAPTSS